MSKRTAVIDIGSNSVRMVIFERTSRFAFHLLHETKSRVRISEKAYENSGNLQEAPLDRAFSALKEFSYIINEHKVHKILCIATSALRDAPNKKDFIKKVNKELNLNIKIIQGEREAYLGGIAAANLLHLDSALTIDIGGGSTELALFSEKKVTQTYSLDIGTIRLKELFFDNNDIKGAKEYIAHELKKVPSDVKHEKLVGIGGTLRAISKMVMDKEEVQFRKLHGYTYKVKHQKEYFSSILKADEEELRGLGVKKERLDIIQAGLLILSTLIEHLGVKSIISSGVGVREGLFLSDLLRSQQDAFPTNYNPSVTSLSDRFTQDKNTYLVEQSSKLFDLVSESIQLNKKHKKAFSLAIKLSQIGKELDYYESHRHAYYILLNGLNYGFSHNETVLISTLVRYQRKKQPHKVHIQKYKDYLPSEETCNSLSNLMRLCLDLFNDFKQADGVNLSIDKNVLQIKVKDAYLLKEKLKDIQESSFLKIQII